MTSMRDFEANGYKFVLLNDPHGGVILRNDVEYDFTNDDCINALHDAQEFHMMLTIF